MKLIGVDSVIDLHRTLEDALSDIDPSMADATE
jgi:hypothetical protein